MWFKVDDSFYMHPKVLGLSARAGWLWLRAGCWSAQQMTDGLIPGDIVHVLGGSKKDADELVEAGLWEHVQGDYGFHDWEKYQFTAEEIRARRKANADRQKKWRDSHRGSDGKFVSNGVSNALVTDESNALVTPPRPVPSRPDQTRSGYVDPSVLVSRRGREDGTDQFQGFYEQHHIDPGRVQSVWSQVFGEDITGMEIVALFQQLQMRAKATILDGTGYILATIRDQPGTCQNLLVKGAA